MTAKAKPTLTKPTKRRSATCWNTCLWPKKIGQMTQAEKNSIPPEDVTTYHIGSVLTGGGGNPEPNSPATWAAMVRAYIDAAQASRLAIPLLYGVDAVHGHNNVQGAMIFPHNIGLGAANDPDLMERITAITAREMLATHARWTFAPAVSVPQDIRWGRIYEGFNEDTERVIPLALAFLRGLLQAGLPVLHSMKHFVGDGGTTWGSTRLSSWEDGSNWQASTGGFKIDQGDTQVDEATLRRVHLRPYVAAIEEGALNIMVSFSSWHGMKMHHQRYLLTDVLKGEYGFAGFFVSDWKGVDQISASYYESVVASINAGMDMVMVPYDYKTFIATLTDAVNKGDITLARIDDAVRRILRVKYALGLFDSPYGDESLLSQVGSAERRAATRETARKSAILLKNEVHTLPLAKTASRLLAGGVTADDVGLQCGGWTLSWQGDSKASSISPAGTTLLEAIRQTVSDPSVVHYAADGTFDEGLSADIGLAVVAENPYAEGFGDNPNPRLSDDDTAMLQQIRARCQRLAVLLLSGRPVLLADELPLMDALVAAWQFGRWHVPGQYQPWQHRQHRPRYAGGHRRECRAIGRECLRLPHRRWLGL